MELCFDSLTNILKGKSKCFDRNTSEAINLIEFFISGQLFKELVECVHYLHELEPKLIIHRNLIHRLSALYRTRSHDWNKWQTIEKFI